MADGWMPNIKTGEELKELASSPKRKTIFKAEIAKKNLGDAMLPKHPVTVGPDGKRETFTDRREKNRSKMGSEEYTAKMRNRPGLRERGIALGKAWKGKKQSLNHLKNRMKAIHGDEWEPKA